MARVRLSSAALAATFGVAVALLWPLAALGEERIALVVGNSGYATGRLANPRNDAESVGRALRSVGFDVTTLLDADRETMRQAVLKFGRRLKSADSVGLFYFAGHGVQAGGQNFLLPVDADVGNEAEVSLQALNLSEILATMKASASRISIAILDACRNNPFSSATRGPIAGLAPVTAPAGTLIAYATAPGEVAYDGEGGNSPYSAALARVLPTPGLTLEDVFKRTREAVLKVTTGRQTPWEHSSLIGTFYFRVKPAEPEPSGVAVIDPATSERLKELGDWNRIKTSKDPEAFRRHIATYPGGAFEEFAHYKIDQMARQPKGWSSLLTGATSVPAGRSAGESLYEAAIKLETEGGPQQAEAARLFRSAADHGLVPAMYALARAYELGLGVERNSAEAVRWLQRAVDQGGHAAAMGLLGSHYEFGNGIGRDLAEALRLYRLAAEQGDPHAMTSLAYLYAEGKGAARNAVEARQWYQRAVDRGHARAMYNLAFLLQRGEGGAADPAAALALLRAAADRRHAGAQRELGRLYDEGRGVPRQPAMAADLILASVKLATLDAASLDGIGAVSFATRRELQRRLAESGHYKGRVTGFWTRETRVALSSYAKAP